MPDMANLLLDVSPALVADDDAIRQQAADWIVQLDGAHGDTERQVLHAACQAWCAQDVRHAQIFRQMQQLWQAAAQPARARRSKKVAIATLVTALAIWFVLPTERWLADVRVAPGQVRQLTLDDGSTLTLDSGSSVDIRFDGKVREIRLHAGRLLADVAKDPQGRAFRVVGRDGSAQAMGTRYIVDQQTDDTAVNVLESSVAVASRNHPQQTVMLHAGQVVRYTRDAVGAVEPAPGASASEAWVHGRLVFNAAPLSEVVAELARHRRGILTMRQADALADLRFTGVLPANDSEAALRILMQALPVAVVSVTPYVIWLEPHKLPTEK